MTHLKRQGMPKNWPIKRKGTTFIVKPLSKEGIPVLMVLRDLLKIAQTRKEVKKAIHKKLFLINNKTVKNEKACMTLFDTISLLPSKKYYKLTLSNKGKYKLEEINEDKSNKKIAKVINKKILKKKKVQLNLNDGLNFISEMKCNTNDSVLIDLKEKKVEKCIPLKEKAKVLILAGKHSGEEGQIEKVKKERKMVTINTENEKLNILIKQVIVIE